MTKKQLKDMPPWELRRELVRTLTATRDKMQSLTFIDALEDRSAKERQQAATTLMSVISALGKARVAELKDIREELDQERDDLVEAIEELKKALDAIRNTVEILAKANQVVSVIAKFAKFAKSVVF